MSSIQRYIFLCLILLAAKALAQPYTSRLGMFQVNQIEGCEGLTVTVTPLDPSDCSAGSDPCIIRWLGPDANVATQLVSTAAYTYDDDGVFLLTVNFTGGTQDDITITVVEEVKPSIEVYTCNNNGVTVNVTDRNYYEYVATYSDGTIALINAGSNYRHTRAFAAPGPQSVTVRGRNNNAADNCADTTVSFTTVNAINAPFITALSVRDNSRIELNYNTQPNVLYRIEIAPNNATNFQLLTTAYSAGSATLSQEVVNLRTDDFYYCFRIGAVDPCTGTIRFSNTICSANPDLTVVNNANNLSWQTSLVGVERFRVDRRETGGGTGTITTSTNFSDTNIQCGVDYCYEIVTLYTNGATATSLQKCGIAISTDKPITIQNITASAINPGARLDWILPTGESAEYFDLFKSQATTTYLDRTDQQNYEDPAYTTEAPACYIIAYKDVCGNESDRSAPACPIQLTGSAQRDNVINISWTAYEGWQNGVSGYFVEKYSPDGVLLEAINVGNALSYTDNNEDLDQQNLSYVIRAIATEPGISAALSNTLTIIKSANIYYPSAFTPNGDGLNDIFNVFGRYIVNFELNIFNRWGELIFTGRALDQGWDGTFNGKVMPEGTYTFVATITDQAGRTFQQAGSVLLLTKQ